MTGERVDDPAVRDARAVRAGGLVVPADRCAVDAQGTTVAAGGVRGQARQAFGHLKAVLAAAGLTLDDLVGPVGSHTDLADLADLVVDGPDGVVSLLGALATAMNVAHGGP